MTEQVVPPLAATVPPAPLGTPPIAPPSQPEEADLELRLLRAIFDGPSFS